MPSSVRARSSTISTPSFRSRTSDASRSLACCDWPLAIFCASSWRCNSETLRTLPRPNHSCACRSSSRATRNAGTNRLPMPRERTPSAQVVERRAAGVRRDVAEVFLDAQQLVVLGHAVRTRQRAGLDLARVGAHRDVGDGRVFGLAGTMADHGGVAGTLGHL